MKSVHIKRFALKVFTSCVLIVFVASGSMVTLAASNKPVGELLVTGGVSTDGAAVTINGEPAKSGRTIFSSSTISTSDTSSAVINLGKAGKIQLDPGSTFILNADGNAISGDLSAGSLTVLSAAQSVGVKTLTGDLVTLNAGETANATSGSSSKKAQKGPGGLDWWVWAAIVGGAVAAIIIVVAVSGDDENRVTSPTR